MNYFNEDRTPMEHADERRDFAAEMAEEAELTAEAAQSFAAKVEAYIGADNFEEVKRRNATPLYMGCCASHDFCDANVFLAEAVEEVFGREIDPGSQADADLFNSIFSIARASLFV